MSDITHTNFARSFESDKYRNPLISIIVTHYNYSHFIEESLLSIIAQTYMNWECVVIDDCSDSAHRDEVEKIIDKIGSKKIQILSTDKNVGQTLAFFRAFEFTSGEFVCVLDPDDRYMPTFLAEMLKAHLNATIICPLLCCDQILLKNDSVISGLNTYHKLRFMKWIDGIAQVPENAFEGLLFIPANMPGWHWSATSGMMVRRSAVNYTKPFRALACLNSLDSYLMQGLHLLGGTLFLTKPLVYRGLHDANDWLTSAIYSTNQHHGRPNRKNDTPEHLLDVMDAIRHNGGGEQLDRNMNNESEKRGPTTAIQRWRRSIKKRWKRIIG